MEKFINGITDYDAWRDHAHDNKRYLERMALISLGIKSLADEVKLVSAVNVSELTGKLEGYFSVSTSVLMNKACQAHARIPGSICKDCYAAETASNRSAVAQALETNHIILNNFLISETAWATLQWKTTNGDARVEWGGDVETVTCARNYLRIIKTHPWLNFGVWTKNPGIWYAAFILEGGKPKNMKLILSSLFVNVKATIPEFIKPYVDHRFTVYDPEFVKANGIIINCGGLKCLTCRNCYGDGPFDIAEIKK